MSTSVTVIMRTKNCEWVVEQALVSLFSQNFKDFKLLVIDSGSTDRTLEIVKQFPCDIYSIAARDYFPGRVLNNAVKRCKSDLVVFQNSDTVMLTPDSLEELIQPLQDDSHSVASYGRQIPRPEAWRWVREDYTKSFPSSKPAEWITLSLPIAAIKRRFLQEHPFYTDAWASEDTEWGQWALAQGYHIAYTPNATAMHSHNYSLKEIFGRRFVEGEADAFIYDRKYTLLNALSTWVKHSTREVIKELAELSFADMLHAPIRMAVWHYAYWRGNRLGRERIIDENYDASLGQQTVLARHC